MILQKLENVQTTKKYENMQKSIYYYLQYYQNVEYQHHYREYNKTADFLANLGMDKRDDFSQKKNQVELKQWILQNNILNKLQNDLRQYEANEFEVGWDERIEIIDDEFLILSREEIDWLKAE